MPVIFNGTTITDAVFNGTSLTSIIYNGTTVWQKIVTPSTVDVLVVAGGGSSGTGNDYFTSFNLGGGGGAGGMCEQSGRAISAGTTYTVIVGAGGASRSNSPYSTTGLPGSNSIFDTITSLGGGAGGGEDGYIYRNSIDGGSGGGAWVDEGVVAEPGGAATQGNSGGATGYGTHGAGYPYGGYTYYGAPGGGAGGLGTGRANSITGSSVTYAKGGGYDGLAGQANTGNGGAIQGGLYGITGGSGVVVVRYPNTYSTATVTGSPTYTNTGGYHVYKFTGSGTIRW